MKHLLNSSAQFASSEDGAITVDWVVLTAALVGLGLAALVVVSNGTEDLSGDISTELASMEITDPFASGTVAFEMQQWDARNPGIYDSYASWMEGFADQQLLDHYNNMAQYAETTDTGHPYDTYHDEFWIARDEAISRGLVDPEDAIPTT